MASEFWPDLHFSSCHILIYEYEIFMNYGVSYTIVIQIKSYNYNMMKNRTQNKTNFLHKIKLESQQLVVKYKLYLYQTVDYL